MTNSKAKVSLYPWDPECPKHREWLYKQRVECSWDQEKVEEVWREQQKVGDKCIYWIVSLTSGSIFGIWDGSH